MSYVEWETIVFPTPRRECVEGKESLETGDVGSEGKVAVADLDRGCWIGGGTDGVVE